MNETYTQVGTDPSWIIAFMPAPALIAYYVKSRMLKFERKVSPWALLSILYFFVAALVGIPMEWIFAGACAGGGVATLFAKSAGSMIVRSVLAAFSLALSLFLIFEVQLIDFERIVLEDSQAKFDSIGRHDTAPRGGLRIVAIGPTKHFYEIRPWSSWISYSGSGSSEILGPNITGFSLFWGPHGLIRGDALAERLTKWANVTPVTPKREAPRW